MQTAADKPLLLFHSANLQLLGQPNTFLASGLCKPPLTSLFCSRKGLHRWRRQLRPGDLQRRWYQARRPPCLRPERLHQLRSSTTTTRTTASPPSASTSPAFSPSRAPVASRLLHSCPAPAVFTARVTWRLREGPRVGPEVGPTSALYSCAMPRTGLECPVCRTANSDACPRPTAGIFLRGGRRRVLHRLPRHVHRVRLHRRRQQRRRPRHQLRPDPTAPPSTTCSPTRTTASPSTGDGNSADDHDTGFVRTDGTAIDYTNY
jgi:hypothetical protein